jgi:hypothetical protein
MSDRRESILYEVFGPESLDCRTRRDDLKEAIRINPDIDRVYVAMDENGKQMCLDLLEYMAKNNVKCGKYGVDGGSDYFCKGGWITKEQLFENFL